MIVVQERVFSPVVTRGRRNTNLRKYWVRGTADELEARAAIEDFSPTIDDGLIRQDIDIEPEDEDLWDARVTYDAGSLPKTGDAVFRFSTVGGRSRVTHSKATEIFPHAEVELPPDFRGAINVTDRGVDGVEIVIPTYAFDETHYLPEGLVTDQYRLTVMNLTGRWNQAAFRGFQPGEVLFMGAEGARRVTPAGGTDWEIAFKFAVSPNAQDLAVGGVTGISKPGWDYLWIRSRPSAQSGQHYVEQRTVAAYVERVYDPGDFNLLEIG